MITLGWLGSIALASCGLPQAYTSIRTGKTEGLNVWFLVLWTVGEILTLAAISKDAPLGYLLLNYGCNLVFLSIIWRYYLWPRKPSPPKG